MTDEREETTGLVPVGSSEIVARSAVLVRRGLHLLGAQPLPQDVTMADLRTRANAGDAAAQSALDAAYANGRGVPRDDAQAVLWFRKAAEQGDAGAQSDLGWAYALGLGAEKDDAQAMRWLRKAADQGDAEDQFDLGWVYACGLCVQEDVVQAASWYRKAAEQGHPGAQSNLGWFYATGRGVPQDNVEAYKWIHLATTRARPWDDELSPDKRDELVGKMSRAEIAEAQARVALWTEAFESRVKG